MAREMIFKLLEQPSNWMMLARIQVGHFGKELIMDVNYDPFENKKLYRVIFHSCRKLTWSEIDKRLDTGALDLLVIDIDPLEEGGYKAEIITNGPTIKINLQCERIQVIPDPPKQ